MGMTAACTMSASAHTQVAAAVIDYRAASSSSLLTLMALCSVKRPDSRPFASNGRWSSVRLPSRLRDRQDWHHRFEDLLTIVSPNEVEIAQAMVPLAGALARGGG